MQKILSILDDPCYGSGNCRCLAFRICVFRTRLCAEIGCHHCPSSVSPCERPSCWFHRPSRVWRVRGSAQWPKLLSLLARLTGAERKEDSALRLPSLTRFPTWAKISGQKLLDVELSEACPGRDWPGEAKRCSWWGRGKQSALQQHPRGVK